MAKFKNIKNLTGTVVPSASIPQPTSAQKARRAEPLIVKPIVPLASMTSPVVKKAVSVIPKVGVTKVIEERSVPVKDFVAKQKDAQGLKDKPVTQSRRVGIFVLIMFFAIILQIVLLVSLLYLSPKLIR